MELPLKNKLHEIVAVTKLDEDDYQIFSKYKWNLSDYGYAVGSKGRLHRLIMKAIKGDLVDHINNDKLDNRKNNLRIVSHSQNSQNIKKCDNCTSIYKGVSTKNGKWNCSITINGVQNHYIFDIELHAAYWYDQLALKYFGTCAKIEKPLDFTEPVEKKKKLPMGIHISGDKYTANIKIGTKRYQLGTFKTVDEALNVYNIKKKEIRNQNERIGSEIKRNSEGIAVIYTSNKDEILVDDDKYFNLMKYKWNLVNGYPKTSKFTMHSFLMNPLNGEIIDHFNHNKCDNRLLNLKISNSSLNGHNKSKSNGKTSKYIGVRLLRGKYEASINKNKQYYYIGLFKNEIDAAKAYNVKAIELYGDQANLNII